ncbi:alpha/beta hydrolase [Rufibacter glacialis]|uniref:Alpha/beta hydrolase n=1 Tax=Rufibacter glacialis TaxID=1259555 RepID=A0A5M8Q4K2_9BACT|nr:alpha/beta hydrolase [Rufibacter glacialis]KAA6430769.1 alpha/beta hydrolase [Rufibacter glacialis]GGK86578.1 beta-xylanase [Rufibacter glacialis]
MKKLILLLSFVAVGFSAASQTKPLEIPLYAGKVPNEVPGPNEEAREVRPNQSISLTKVRQPTLTVFLPAKGKANGTAVVICPGGGYAKLAFSHEGTDVAQRLADQGVAAFVVKYRLPHPAVSSQPEITPLQDAQQALYLVRQRAKEYNINPQRVGIMGFSAGGHLASTAGTHFTQTTIPNPENLSLRPDFMVLVYPVISSDSTVWHKGSFELLLGKKASPEKLRAYSNDLQVTAQTPPTFLVHASDDRAVPAQNSVLFYQALLRHKIPAELHLYQAGGHGFGLNNKTTKDQWFDRLVNWLEANKLMANAVK